MKTIFMLLLLASCSDNSDFIRIDHFYMNCQILKKTGGFNTAEVYVDVDYDTKVQTLRCTLGRENGHSTFYTHLKEEEMRGLGIYLGEKK